MMNRQNEIQTQRQHQANEIITRLKAYAPEVLAQFPVEIAYLHGSVAHGRPLPSSDIDIALILTEVPPPYECLTLELRIQAALEDACGLANLDVRSINEAPLLAQGDIVQEGILLYSRNKEQRLAFEILTRKKYFDYQPTATRMRQAFLEHVRQKGLHHGQSKNRRPHSK